MVGYTHSQHQKERDIFLGEAREVAAFTLALSRTWMVRATPEMLKPHLPGAGLAHFSCHGYFNSQDPLASSVALAGGEITARNWMALSLQAELVTLSACQTGLNDVNPGDEVAGFLACAALCRGTRCAAHALVSGGRYHMAVDVNFLSQGLEPARPTSDEQGQGFPRKCVGIAQSTPRPILLGAVYPGRRGRLIVMEAKMDEIWFEDELLLSEEALEAVSGSLAKQFKGERRVIFADLANQARGIVRALKPDWAPF